ncbi:substrate-binding domain-containing protein [Spiractinospora alimapuensis]|nr:substrate-binding domain-containing protein [Spiractinospora alimapuensis]
MRHSSDRVEGYRAALEAGRTEVDESLIIEVDRLLVEGDLGQVCGGRAARALLDREDPPTAIFACDDHLALGALEAVPTDYSSPRAVSVVGFDDLPYTMFNLPLLTTIGQPVREMAMYATRMVLNHVPGTPLPAERVEFPTEFVLRETAHGPIPSTAD